MGQIAHRPALLPLRGLRFRAQPGELARHIGPPMDIESSAAARAWTRGRPHNAVRLEIADADDELRFTQARRLLSAWRRDGVVRADARPSFYVYEQTFSDRGVRRARRGLLGLVPLDVPEVCVLPHEDTWEDNLARRAQLLRDLNASLSPIFLLYNRANDDLPALLDTATQRPPDASGDDEFGEGHRLWVVDDPAAVARIQRAMQDRHYVIADGHHRFAAARIFHQERPTPEHGVILANCVESDDPGIIIRPIHRLVRRAPVAWDAALTKLERWFGIARAPVDASSGWDLVARLGADGLPRLGLLAPGGSELVTLQLRAWDAIDDLLPRDLVDPARRLDVTVATELVLRRAFGLEQPADSPDVDYTNDPDIALAETRAGQAAFALLLRPPLLAQVMAVARAGGRMPPKSTSFMPKTPIGLVMHDFQPDSMEG